MSRSTKTESNAVAHKTKKKVCKGKKENEKQRKRHKAASTGANSGHRQSQQHQKQNNFFFLHCTVNTGKAISFERQWDGELGGASTPQCARPFTQTRISFIATESIMAPEESRPHHLRSSSKKAASQHTGKALVNAAHLKALALALALPSSSPPVPRFRFHVSSFLFCFLPRIQSTKKVT